MNNSQFKNIKCVNVNTPLQIRQSQHSNTHAGIKIERIPTKTTTAM